jgi:1-phosphatidylinositol-4-phosphate 5-kinase
MGNITSLKEQCSTGKSGSFFYYTADSKYMLKTISHAEFERLKIILKPYYDHIVRYP